MRDRHLSVHRLELEPCEGAPRWSRLLSAARERWTFTGSAAPTLESSKESGSSSNTCVELIHKILLTRPGAISRLKGSVGRQAESRAGHTSVSSRWVLSATSSQRFGWTGTAASLPPRRSGRVPCFESLSAGRSSCCTRPQRAHISVRYSLNARASPLRVCEAPRRTHGPIRDA